MPYLTLPYLTLPSFPFLSLPFPSLPFPSLPLRYVTLHYLNWSRRSSSSTRDDLVAEARESVARAASCDRKLSRRSSVESCHGMSCRVEPSRDQSGAWRVSAALRGARDRETRRAKQQLRRAAARARARRRRCREALAAPWATHGQMRAHHDARKDYIDETLVRLSRRLIEEGWANGLKV